MIKLVELNFTIEPRVKLALSQVRDFLQEQNIASYIVGGFIRDALLSRATADIDIAVSGNALDIASRAALFVKGKYIPLDASNGVARIVLPEDKYGTDRLVIDFSTVTGDIFQDLSRRDFTIDAMAVDLARLVPEDGNIDLIDPFHGYQDIQQKTVRAVNARVFQSDPVRLLRAVRLAAELGFIIEPNTEIKVRQDSSLIRNVSGERIREELLRIFKVPRPELLPELDRLGLVQAIFPELDAARGVEQPKEHYWDVFNHVLRTAAAADFILRTGDWPVLDPGTAKQALAMAPWSQWLENYFSLEVSAGSSRRTLLKLAGLLHDIAKPQTKTVQPDGRTRFLEHPRLGAVATADILERLRFSTKEIKLVANMIEYHLRPTQLNSPSEMPTRRAIYRYFRDTGDAAIDTLFLSLADHLASRGPKLELDNWRIHNNIIRYVLHEFFNPEKTVSPPRLINGHDIIQIFDLEPGPVIKNLLESVREAQANGEINTRQEALAYIKKIIEKQEPEA